MTDYFGRDKWSTLPERGHAEDNFFATGLASSTTEDAIEQLRSKRQMSRMEVPSDVSSQDKPAENEEGSRNKLRPSSSNMTSFELSDGHPYGPHVPASIDADDYLEYSLDNSLSDFPSNLEEEEERMFREAMMESLKDMGTLSNNTTEHSLDGNSEKPNSLPNGYESSVLLPCSEPDIQSATIGHNSADQIQSDDKLLMFSTQSEQHTLAETSNSPANTVSSANGIETVGFTKAMSSTQSEPQTLAETSNSSANAVSSSNGIETVGLTKAL